MRLIDKKAAKKQKELQKLKIFIKLFNKNKFLNRYKNYL
jgi:hypothetical protein